MNENCCNNMMAGNCGCNVCGCEPACPKKTGGCGCIIMVIIIVLILCCCCGNNNNGSSCNMPTCC